MPSTTASVGLSTDAGYGPQYLTVYLMTFAGWSCGRPAKEDVGGPGRGALSDSVLMFGREYWRQVVKIEEQMAVGRIQTFELIERMDYYIFSKFHQGEDSILSHD